MKLVQNLTGLHFCRTLLTGMTTVKHILYC